MKNKPKAEPKIKFNPSWGAQAKPLPLPKKHPVPKGSPRLRYVELKAHQCKYELSGAVNIPYEDYRFCGLKTVNGCPYCDYHMRICFTGAKK